MRVEEKKILESGEDYLERILMLSEGGKRHVKAIDIVNSMGYSKPSVSIALKKLEAQGYVEVSEHQHLHLTQKGLEVATKMLERHELFAKMLMSLGVSEEQAYVDSCRVEHHLSDESWNALKKHFVDNN